MRKTIYVLSAVLAAQVALAVGLNLGGGLLGGQQAGTQLLAFAPADVQTLTITDSEGQAVTLARAGEGWKLPGQGDFPVAPGKVKDLLADLTAARESPPVATSSAAPKRFKVADDAFERKLVFGGADKTLATVFLGSAQGTRQVHVRRDGQDGVRRIDFDVYRAPAKPDDWADNTVLKVEADKIAALAWGEVKVERVPAAAGADTAAAAGDKAAPTAVGDAAPAGTDAAAPAWQLAGQPPQPLDPAPVKTLTDKLGSFLIISLAPAEAQKLPEGAVPALDLAITLTDGSSRNYRIFKGEKEGDYTVAASTQTWLMRLSSSMAESLIKATADPAFAPVRAATLHGAAVTDPAAGGG